MKHRAFIYDRGARTRIGEVRGLTLVRWNRIRDDISTADVRASATLCDGIISYRNIGRYELVITRNGKREWEGPITYLKHSGPELEIHAKDVLWYANRAPLTKDWDNSGKKIGFCVDRIDSIFRYELANRESMSPPINVLPNLKILTNPKGARTSKKTVAYQKYVWQELDDMAWRQGIDYTVVRRTLMVWDNHDEPARTRPVTEKDFNSDFDITAYGVELATGVHVTDGEGRVGSYGPMLDPYYGRMELLATEYEEGEKDNQTSVAELRSQAQRNYSGRNPTPVSVRVPENSELDPCAVDELWELLFPGVRMPVELTSPYMPDVTQVHVLNTMTVQENEKGETVSISIGSAAQEEVTEG